MSGPILQRVKRGVSLRSISMRRTSYCRRAKGAAHAEEGATAVEYAVIIGLIVLALFGAVRAVGSVVSDSFGESGSRLSATGTNS